jgi:hypothetical protein
MPFIYTPSIFGFAGAIIFLVLALVSLTAGPIDWLNTAIWGLLGAAFLLKHLPKFLVLKTLNLVALAMLAVGMVLFLVEFLPNIS